MADFRSIAAVGKSIERQLNVGFALLEPIDGATPTRATLVQTEDLSAAGTTGSRLAIPGLSIFLYRIEVNSAVRATWSAHGSNRGTTHLPLDLHYLLTPWGANAEHEHQIIGRTMQILDEVPSLAGPLLHPSAAWEAGESVQIRTSQLATQDLMDTFDSLPVDFRVSVPYTASVIRLDGVDDPAGRLVDTAFIGVTAAAELVP